MLLDLATTRGLKRKYEELKKDDLEIFIDNSGINIQMACDHHGSRLYQDITLNKDDAKDLWLSMGRMLGFSKDDLPDRPDA